MGKVLDLNSVQRPTLDLTLMDDNKTMLRLGMPTESMVNELQNMQPELKKMETGDRDAVELIYDLAARLISCNRDHIKVTAEELRTKYRVDLESLLIFFSAYLDFINEITNEKN